MKPHLIIREELAAQGMTQKELAERTGLTENGLYRILNGSRTPRPETLEAIGRALGGEFEITFKKTRQ